MSEESERKICGSTDDFPAHTFAPPQEPHAYANTSECQWRWVPVVCVPGGCVSFGHWNAPVPWVPSGVEQVAQEGIGGSRRGQPHRSGRKRGNTGGNSEAMTPIIIQTQASLLLNNVKAGFPLKDDAWQMACFPEGSRAIQLAIDEAKLDAELLGLAKIFHGHVFEAILDKNAHFVIQSFVKTTSPKVSHFIIDEMMRSNFTIVDFAQHRHGCHVVKLLVQHCPDHSGGMVEEILHDSVRLCKHEFGNFVVQHILEHGTQMQKHQLAEIIQKHAGALCKNFHAVAVVSAALCTGSECDRVAVAEAVLEQQGLVSMAKSRHGNAAVRRWLLPKLSLEKRKTAENFLSA